MTVDPSASSSTPGRLLVLGANGPTGRQVVQQASERGYHVLASTRDPDAFPDRDERVRLVVGDATDPDVLDGAVAASDAVICTIGTRFTAGPVEVYLPPPERWSRRCAATVVSDSSS